MSITSIKEIHDGRDGESEITQQGKTIRRYTRVFRILTDDNYSEAAAVKSAMPALGAVYPYDPAAYCRRKSARNESFSKRVWIGTCSYSSERETTENPLDEPAEITWTTEQFQRPFAKDRDDKGVLNSAGDYYDPPVQGDDSRWVVSVKKNVAAVPLAILAYRDAVNDDQFVIDGVSVEEDWAKVQQIEIGPVQERNDVEYRVFSYKLALNEDGWTKKELDQGFREKDPEDETKRRKITDQDGKPVHTPVLLDGEGHKLEDPSLDNAHFNDHPIYEQKTFSGFLPME